MDAVIMPWVPARRLAAVPVAEIMRTYQLDGIVCCFGCNAEKTEQVPAGQQAGMGLEKYPFQVVAEKRSQCSMEKWLPPASGGKITAREVEEKGCLDEKIGHHLYKIG